MRKLWDIYCIAAFNSPFPLFGSLISTVLIALSLFTFDGRMALAALWVITVSVAIVVGSYRVQGKVPVSYTHLDVYKRQGRKRSHHVACEKGLRPS